MRGYVTVGIVVFIVVVLACLLLPAVSRVREPAMRIQCANNLKEIVLAAHNYDEIAGHFPRGTILQERLPPEERLSWMVQLLPYLEQDRVYKSIDLERGWQAERNVSAVNTPIKSFRCPANIDLAAPSPTNATYYVGLTGLGADSAHLPNESPRAGFFGYERVVSVKDVKDGFSCTIMVIETTSNLGPWAAGGVPTLRAVDTDQQPYIGDGRPFGGLHHKGNRLFGTTSLVLVGMADGSTRQLQESINPQTFEALVTIAGGEKIDADDY